MSQARLTSIFVLLFAVSCSTSQKNQTPQRSFFAVQQSSEERRQSEAVGRKYAVASEGRATTDAARRILAQGGNMIDAAVAASFVVSVERPHSTGIGGGGFLLFREAKSGKTYAVDFRERAPLAATEKMFLNSKGEVIPRLSIEGILAAGVPGLVAGLFEVHRKWGKLPWAQLLQPAIELAEEGFEVYPSLVRALNAKKGLLASFPSTAAVFLKSDATSYEQGEILRQKDLATSLRKIAKEGSEAFYKAAIAKAIIKESKARRGMITQKDLSSYQVKWRSVVEGTYKGYQLLSMPPPSSGGTHVIEILNILEKDNLSAMGFASADALHLEASAMQQAFADRAAFMGDPDFYKEIPLKGLLSKEYAQSIRAKIDLNKARPSAQLHAGEAQKYESSETTHISMMDAEGNVVVTTQTINGWFGSGVVVPGTGILLNNEMDDFSAKPGASNLFGAIGGVPNAIAPRKTPLSSMSPTIVLKEGKVVLALGAPGGTRIITCVAQTALNYLEFKLPLYESVANIRLHHQWQPDQLELESPGPAPEVIEALREKGHKVKLDAIPCRVNAVAREGEQLRAVSDPRDHGASYAE